MSSALLSPLADSFYLPGDNGRAVLLIHGFTGSPAHMRPLGEKLHDAGFSVLGIRLTGHGTDIADMLKAGAMDWLTDARTAFERLRAEADGVSVAGLSMGGVLALILASDYDGVRSLVSLSAPMGTASPMSRYAGLLAWACPVLPKRADPARRLLDGRYDIGYDAIPLARLSDLHSLISRARDRLGEVRCPILCVQSEKDRTIDLRSADIILDGVSSQVKKRLTLTASPHVITIGPEREALEQAVTDFLLTN